MTARLVLLGSLAAIALVLAWFIPQVQRPPDRWEVAMELFEQGRAGEAVYLFEDQAWRGVAEYRAGRFRRALGAFLSEENTLTLYNAGNAYARLQEWAGAKAAYRKVLRLDPTHLDARHNLELVLRAEELEQALLAEARSQDARGIWKDGDREQPERGDGESDEIEQGGAREGAERSAEATTDQSGRSDLAGRSGERPLSDGALGGPSDADSAGAATADARTGSGAVALRRESAQAAEILLREIVDDPAKVLAARLRMAYRRRLEKEAQ